MNTNIAEVSGVQGIDLARANDPFYPRFWPERLKKLGYCEARIPDKYQPKQRGIFCCDMSDLFGIGVPEDWTSQVLKAIKGCYRDRFYLLTKQPQNLVKFSPFPDNAWVGISVTNRQQLKVAREVFSNPISHKLGIRAKVKYMSIEPLLDSIVCNHVWRTEFEGGVFSRNRTMPITKCSICGDTRPWGIDNIFTDGEGKPLLDWLIIGSQTKPYNPPKIEWVKEIVEAADKVGVPVFLKDNLKQLIYGQKEEFYGPHGVMTLRQEMPDG